MLLVSQSFALAVDPNGNPYVAYTPSTGVAKYGFVYEYAQAPISVSGVTYNVNTGILDVAGTNLTTSAADYTAADITLTGLGGGTWTLHGDTVVSGTPNSSHVKFLLSAQDQTGVDALFGVDGTKATDNVSYNFAGTLNWDSGARAVTTQGVTVSGHPALTAATYDSTTGKLTLSGTNLTTSAGDFDLSKFTLTGDTGTTSVLTGGTVEANPISTRVIIDLNAASFNALLDQNGLVAANNSTTYNLAYTAGWDSVSSGANSTLAVAVVGYAPSITTASYDAATGKLTVTGSNFSAGTSDYLLSKYTVLGEGTTSYTLTGGTVESSPSATHMVIDLTAADQLAVDGLLNKTGTSSQGGTTYNLSTSAGWDTGGLAVTTAGVTVSNPVVPTITSVAYNGTSGILTLTGTHLVNQGASNGLVLADLTLTGEGPASYTLSNTGDVLGTLSATSVSITLNGADRTNVDTLFNVTGTSSATSHTTYNFAAIAGWDSNIGATITTKGVTVTNPPAITGVSYDETTGKLTVTGVKLTTTASDYTVGDFTIRGQGGSTRVLNSSYSTVEASPTTTQFVIDLTGADKTAVDSLLNSNGTSSNGGTVYNLAGTGAWDTGGSSFSTQGITVSGWVPTITSVTYAASTGQLQINGSGFTRSTSDVDLTKLTLTGDGGTSFTLSGGSAVYSITSSRVTINLNTADMLALNGLLNKNGGFAADNATTYNLNTAVNWDTGAGSQPVNSITASVSQPTISTVAYDGSTGILTFAGSSFANHGSSAGVNVSSFTLTGVGGTYTLTGAALAVTSSTGFSLTLGATDKAQVDILLNAVGTQSGSVTYALSVPSGWDSDFGSSRNGGITVTAIKAAVSQVVPPTQHPPPPAVVAPPTTGVPTPPAAADPGTIAGPGRDGAPAGKDNFAPIPVPVPASVPTSTVTTDRGSGTIGGDRAATAPTAPAANANIVQAPATFSLAATSQLTASSEGGFRVPVIAASQRASMGSDALVAVRPVAQVQETAAGFSFAVPADTFAHTRPDAVVNLTAAQLDGQALPSWLAFNAKTGAFTGKPPAGFEGTVVVRVVARDQNGREAFATIRISVGEKPAPAAAPAKTGQLHRDKPMGKLAFTQQLKLAARNAAIRFS